MRTKVEKRGKQSVTHYFHDFLEQDGSQSTVYLGKHKAKAEKHLKHHHLIRSEKKQNHKLIKELDSIQDRLLNIADNFQPVDQKIAKITQDHYRHRHADNLFHSAPKPLTSNGSMMWIVLLVLAVASFVSVGSFLLSGSSITGFTVTEEATPVDITEPKISMAIKTTLAFLAQAGIAGKILPVFLISTIVATCLVYAGERRLHRYRPLH